MPYQRRSWPRYLWAQIISNLIPTEVSLLLTLPRELRDHIYHFYFDGYYGKQYASSPCTSAIQYNFGLQLLFVNRQIYHEATDIFYLFHYSRILISVTGPDAATGFFNSVGLYHPECNGQMQVQPNKPNFLDNFDPFRRDRSFRTPFPPRRDFWHEGHALAVHTYIRLRVGDDEFERLRDDYHHGSQKAPWYLCGPNWVIKIRYIPDKGFEFEGPIGYLRTLWTVDPPVGDLKLLDSSGKDLTKRQVTSEV